MIDSLDVLEATGVLASAGHLVTLEKLMIKRIDMTNIPVDIVNSLTKIVRNSLEFYRVTGFCFSILEDIKSERLSLKKMKLPAQPTQEIRINVCDTVNFEKLSGNICGLMESIVCEGSNSLKYLELLDFDL